ncbi:MAG: DUF1559 domain-containing protein [Planctomycetaceae bacterium]
MRSKRFGFTLIELLVVIAIVAILVALLLPAVQQVRSAARTAQCQDHLHNLGIALHAYEGSHGTLPPGWVAVPLRSDGSPGDNSSHRWGWGTMILPFIEQKPLYDLLSQDSYSFGREWRSGSGELPSTEIELFGCPTDTMPLFNTTFGSGKSNYLGSYGHRPIDTANYSQFEGVFSRNSRVRFAQVTDGMSNTIFLGERAGGTVRGRDYSPTAGLWVGIQRFDRPYQQVARGPDSATNYVNSVNGINRWTLTVSLHPGGGQVAMGDGKVAFLSENIDLLLYQNLIGRSDGNPVRVP